MIIELKKQLLEDPQHIINILQQYDFYNITSSSSEIRCGIAEERNKSSVRIKLKNNDNLYVKDFGRDISCDLFKYIIQMKNITFKDVISNVKKELNINNLDCFYEIKKPVFGGFYDKIKSYKSDDYTYKTYSDDILNKYEHKLNLRFLEDHISLESQQFFNIMFDIESQRIIIPIYDWCGNIIGIKGRANWEIREDEPKYLYLIPCRISDTLYGYYQNYSYLTNDTIILVEAEKSVLQAYTYGYRNVIALGGNSLSDKQSRLIIALNPSKVIFAYDEGLDKNIINKNINKLKMYTRLYDTQIGYWDYLNSKYIEEGSKNSITDNGKELFEKILKEEVIF